ncbi:hypothetical protein A5777_06010 [Gordonia sp. 852002-10350_SCH5691597]|nr:hypothetical protein A5777_06010 [Gordonia sp. 852002-10350_SCH5691597]
MARPPQRKQGARRRRRRSRTDLSANSPVHEGDSEMTPRTTTNSVSEPVLSRVFEYWRNVDEDLGKKVESGVRAGL